MKVFLAALTLLLALAGAQVELEREVFEIARGLRCPTCVSESVADSNAEISVQMREIIREHLQEGRSAGEIRDFFVARYGNWILLDPPRSGVHLIVWIAPIVGGLLALSLLIYYVRRWTENAEAPLEADAGYLERVRQELKDDA